MLQKKRRLVSTSLNGLVIEWDLQGKNIKSKYNCHCAIWDSKMLGKFLYVACEDGSIRILKVKKQKIELVKMLVKSSASCLSIDVVQDAPKEEKIKKTKKTKKDNSDSESSDDVEEEEVSGPASYVFAGYSDGTIKKWEVKTGNSILHIEKATKK